MNPSVKTEAKRRINSILARYEEFQHEVKAFRTFVNANRDGLSCCLATDLLNTVEYIDQTGYEDCDCYYGNAAHLEVDEAVKEVKEAIERTNHG